jgi:hypothetical protein
MDAETAVLPVGLAKMPPGPELAVALSTVDFGGLPAELLQVALAAQGRQSSHEQARLLAAGVALARIPWEGPDPVRRDQADTFVSTRVAWTLTMSERSADKLLDLGFDLIDRLPMVYEALLAGRIDYPRAWTISNTLALLPDDAARAIAASLLTEAERLTPGKLKARLALRALKADPGLAKRRYKRSVADRRVHIGTDSEGTARLSGQNLPVDRAAAAEDRIDRLARAAKADGDTRTLDQLRADAMLDVLTGNPFKVRPDIDPLTGEADREEAAEQAARRASGPDESLRAAVERIAASRAASRAAARARDEAWTHPTRPDHTDPDHTDPDHTDPDHTPNGNHQSSPDHRADGEDPPDPAWARDQVGAAERAWADQQSWAHDRDVNQTHGNADRGTGEEGRSGDRLRGGSVPKGPEPPGAGMCTCGGLRPAERRGVVDIIVPLSTLIKATDHPGLIPGWGPVIADIARQVAFDQEANPSWKWSVTDGSGQLMHHGHTKRRPVAAEKAFIQARDRTCRAPGCTRRATRCDIDHNVQYADDGPSHRGNTCCLCERHHLLKTEIGFAIHHVGTAGFLWQGPDGALYFAPPDGNIIAIEEALDDQNLDGQGRDGWDLDDTPKLGPVKHIIPT